MWGNIFLENHLQYNFNFNFPNRHSVNFLKLIIWQYWWWFFFTLFFIIYYMICIRIFLKRTFKFRPKIVSAYRAHGRWGDILVSLVPIFWCFSILFHSNGLLKLNEMQTETSVITIRVRGRQWYWIYKIDLHNLLNFNFKNKIFRKMKITNYFNNNINMYDMYFKFWKNIFFSKNYKQFNQKLNTNYLLNEQKSDLYKYKKKTFFKKFYNNNFVKNNFYVIFKNNLIFEKFENFKSQKDERSKEFFRKVFGEKIFTNARPMSWEHYKLKLKNGKKFSNKNIYQNFQYFIKQNDNFSENFQLKKSFYNFIFFNKNNLFTKLKNKNQGKNLLLKLKFNQQLKENINYKEYKIILKKPYLYDFKKKNIKSNVNIIEVMFYKNFFFKKPNLNDQYSIVIDQNKKILYNNYENNYSNKFNNLNLEQKKIIFKEYNTGSLKKDKLLNNVYQQSIKPIKTKKNFYFFNYNDLIFSKTNNNFQKKKKLNKSLLFNQRLLQTNSVLVLPIKKNITIITNSYDVIHSWFIPGLGIKMDCVPGRSTHHTLFIKTPGLFYGQCAEICGRFHHHMPIKIAAVNWEHFILWWQHHTKNLSTNPLNKDINKKLLKNLKKNKNIFYNRRLSI